MKIKLTREAIFNLWRGLNSVGNLEGAKFSYAVARNKNAIKGEIDSIAAAEIPDEGFKQYNKERVELAEKHAVKVDGKPQTEIKDGLQRYVLENEELFEKEFSELKEKHRESVDKRTKQLEEVKALLNEEIEIDLFSIPMSYLPEKIKAEQASALLPIIIEE